jgi:hypothetical protein
MCDMISMAIAGVASTALSAYGQIQAGQQAQAAADYNAAVARNNQIIADRQAEDAVKRGQVAEEEQRRRTRAIAGTQRAALAASGVQLDQGSPADILADTAQFGELDALTIRNNAEREAYGYRVQGMNFGAEAGLQQGRASSAMTGAYLGAGSTLLSGATSVADRWYTQRRLNAPRTT